MTTQTHTPTCKACGSACTHGRATAIGNYGTLCAACLVILKAGVDPSEGRDRLHKRVDCTTLTYSDPLAPIRQWRAIEQATMAARPADSVALCGCCNERYATRGLAALDSDAVYDAAIAHESLGDRETLLCRFCRERLEATYSTEKPDVYHVLDYGMYKTDR